MSELLNRIICNQKTNEWYKIRHDNITASEVASILDANTYESKYDLLKRKCSELKPQQDNASMAWGNKFEKVARRIYELVTENQTENIGIIRHESIPWLLASPDAIIKISSSSSGISTYRLLEIKCPYHRIIYDKLIPYIYQIQVQIQLEVCGIDSADYIECSFNELNYEDYEKSNAEYKGYIKNDVVYVNHDSECKQLVLGKEECGNISFWELKKYSINKIERNQQWFMATLPKLEEFWKQLCYYKTVGIDKLHSDKKEQIIYYNIETGAIQKLRRSSRIHEKTQSDNSKGDVLPDSRSDHKPLRGSLDSRSEYKLVLSPLILGKRTNSASNNICEDDFSIDQKNSTINLEAKHNSALELKKNTDSDPVRKKRKLRKNEESDENVICDWEEWIFVTNVQNYMRDDPLLDYLNLLNRNKLAIKTGNDEVDNLYLRNEEEMRDNQCFAHFLTLRGHEFESAVIDHLYQNYPDKIVTVANNYQARNKAKFRETVRLMNEGAKIIYHGVLHDYIDKIYGMPDLIVKGDCLHIFNKKRPLTAIRADWYYIVDIKYTTLNLRADGLHLLNQDSIYAYKGQVYLYTKILNSIRGQNASFGYLLGRKWKYTKNGETYDGNGWFDKLGQIDYYAVDKDIVEKTNAAIDWLRDLEKNYTQFVILPPNNKNLYPNMNNTQDTPWRPIKEAISAIIGEITELWMCGVKNRNTAIKNGFSNWKDSKCTVENLGFKSDSKIALTIKKIMEINKQENKEIIMSGTSPNGPEALKGVSGIREAKQSPSEISGKIKNNIGMWKNRADIEFFIDFETIMDLVEGLNSNIAITRTHTYLFMAGIGYAHNDRWIYRNFCVECIDEGENEKKLFGEMQNYIRECISTHNAKNYRFYHWSGAEKRLYETMYYKYGDESKFCIKNWCDMLDVFRCEPIVIKGAFNFSLKSIAGALKAQGLINTIWKGDVCDGMNAMVRAIECNTEIKKRKIKLTQHPTIEKIIHYNEVDCKVMWEILNYIRTRA